eukprot:CAMPEP_0172578848 /NCGR_PEP_ID=MMETSP1067-20121228/138945_1 /TAXON_ID=265564 ORGANISM="Thalassiosira punctigera, Strain Tpunct2005C2" /NCGR_SAMPLE_ID=MMETSP1067 /ASSEMBLY_ACC=CAM_ASM_000444 /LENGTH=724 /DNA_ID=CAMNT_0013371553 /DNA_START=21 /DNA_END=2195 /DNA_ORIENTATION=+
MARTKEEREQRRLEAKLRAEKRKAAKAEAAAALGSGGGDGAAQKDDKPNPNDLRNNLPVSRERNSSLPALSLPVDALAKVLRYLPAREWGALSLTCTGINRVLGGCRAAHVSSRVMRREDGEGKQSSCGSMCLVGGLRLCGGRKEAQEIIARSLAGGGETGRLITKKMKRSNKQNDSGDVDCDEYPGYARFVEEATIGYSAMQCSRTALFPTHLQGRFVSCSPEHTLLRMGGGGDTSSGPGGSGCCTWGVGARGQLGHGKREDEAEPRMLLGKIGWGVRIVQVAAGGGLVRVAHSLLLTSTGRVLSFGTAQYGQLGHGYDAGKQLSDCLRPRYIDALKDEKCICVAAGELHSGAVTIDGDVYTWGEGFCGQLGLGDRRPHLLPEQVTLGGLEDECVSNMSCGCRHTLVTTEEGEVFSWGLGRFGVLGRSYTDFTYQNDVGMVVPEGDEGHVQGAAANPPPMPAAAMDTVVVVANGGAVVAEMNVEGVNALMESLEALNLTLDDPSDQCYPKVIDSLQGFRAVGVCAGHRHSMILDEHGGLYTFGSGASGALGHGDFIGQEYPMKVMEFDNKRVRIHQMSAGVDISMAVSTEGTVYAWGKATNGRLGLGMEDRGITLPNTVEVGDEAFKAVDVECAYVHSLIVGLDGSVYQCGGVGTDGRDDGQQDVESAEGLLGSPVMLSGYNIWHRVAEPKAAKVAKQQWTKYGKYELKGRSKMMEEGVRSVA